MIIKMYKVVLLFSIVVSCNAHVLLHFTDRTHSRSERSDESVQHISSKQHSKRSHCSPQTISELRKQVKCDPRPTIVYLGESNDTILMPPAVLVNRCNGFCRSGRCVATETKQKTFYVNQFDLRTTQKYCTTRVIDEDTKCECECQQKSTECTNKFQMYDSNECRCVCLNQVEKNSCMGKQAEKYWDEKDCACYCREKACTTGSVWDKRQCKCVNNNK